MRLEGTGKTAGRPDLRLGQQAALKSGRRWRGSFFKNAASSTPFKNSARLVNLSRRDSAPHNLRGWSQTRSRPPRLSETCEDLHTTTRSALRRETSGQHSMAHAKCLDYLISTFPLGLLLERLRELRAEAEVEVHGRASRSRCPAKNGHQNV